MKLDNVDILELLPSWMAEESDVKALAVGTNDEAKEAYRESLLLSRWNKIDQLGEEYLDSLAKELNVPWYRTDADIEAKRRIIKNSDLVHKILGTKKAVEMVVNDYFENGEVREWYEYGGDPYHFRVVSERSFQTSSQVMEVFGVTPGMARPRTALKASSALWSVVEVASPIFASAYTR